jgi:hypothetical protein
LMVRRRWWWWWWSPPNPHPGRMPERTFSFRIAVSGGGGAAELYLGLARATRWCVPPVAPLHLVLWLCVSSDKIGTLRYFPGFFLKVRFLHKNKTPGQFCWKQR